jgi:hypothetical protein
VESPPRQCATRRVPPREAESQITRPVRSTAVAMLRSAQKAVARGRDGVARALAAVGHPTVRGQRTERLDLLGPQLVDPRLCGQRPVAQLVAFLR